MDMLARKHASMMRGEQVGKVWTPTQRRKFEAFVVWFNVGASLFHEERPIDEWIEIQKQVYEGLCWKNFGNLPKNSNQLYTGLITYDAWKSSAAGGTRITCEHRYPKTPWFRCLLKLFGPANPMTLETFLWLYENDGGTFHKTTPRENDRLRTPQRQDPLDGGATSYAAADVVVRRTEEWAAIHSMLLC